MLKAGALVLHPETRVEDSVSNLDNSAHNGSFVQARGGVFTRIAIIASIMGTVPVADETQGQDSGVAEDGG